jgi:hypothetical protein
LWCPSLQQVAHKTPSQHPLRAQKDHARSRVAVNLSFDKKQRRNYLRMELSGGNGAKPEYWERSLLRISDKVCVLREAIHVRAVVGLIKIRSWLHD